MQRPEQPALSVSVASLAELIHGLGPRGEVAKAWGVAPRTVALRMEKPETASLEDLKKLAALAHLDVSTVFQLALYQMENPVPIPTPQLGRPSRQH